MRKLDNSAQSDTVGLPVKAGIFEHLQLAYQEALTGIGKNIVGAAYQTTIPYVLWGCINTGSGLNYIISAGAILYNDEVFLVDAISFTAAGGQVAVGVIFTSFYTNGDRADPITFTDGTPRTVCQIRKIVFQSGADGSTIFDFSDLQQTSIGLLNDQEPTLGATYTVTFEQDRVVFFAAASVDCTIGFDFTNANPGTVVRLKWTWGSGRLLTVTAGSGNVAYLEGGDPTRAASSTNSMYFIYVGKNEAGHNEVGYSISQIA